MEDTFYAYMAGIVDGEGSIFISKQKRKENRVGYRFYPILVITNTHKGVLDYFVEKTGLGKVFERKEQEKPYFKTAKVAYRWDIKHTQVGTLLKKLLPYLVIKRKQAENVLAFLEMFEGAVNYSNYNVDKQFEFYIKGRLLNGTKLTDEEIEALRPAPVIEKPKQLCSVESCSNKHYGRGLCKIHWKREYYKNMIKAT